MTSRRRLAVRLAILATVAILLSAGTRFAAADATNFRIVAHPGAPAAKLTAKELSSIFLKKKSKWPSGEAVSPVDLPASSPIRAAFSTAVHGKATTAIKSWWQQQIFAGQSVPPPELDGDAEVLAFVRQTPGAIGYVSSAAATDGVRVVAIEP